MLFSREALPQSRSCVCVLLRCGLAAGSALAGLGGHLRRRRSIFAWVPLCAFVLCRFAPHAQKQETFFSNLQPSLPWKCIAVLVFTYKQETLAHERKQETLFLTLAYYPRHSHPPPPPYSSIFCAVPQGDPAHAHGASQSARRIRGLGAGQDGHGY